MGSKYGLIPLNMSSCAKILNMLKSAEIYPNVGKYGIMNITWGWICFVIGICKGSEYTTATQVSEYAWVCSWIML